VTGGVAPAATAAAAAAAPAAKPLSVVLEDIVQEYPAAGGGVTRVIDQVSLRFDRPGINMLLGPSGCGKSTLLHMLGGVRPMDVSTPTAGRC
jgi:ABC-type lipoprotein export system ATPase subunit